MFCVSCSRLQSVIVAFPVHTHFPFLNAGDTFFCCYDRVKCTNYETCAKLHSFHILFILRKRTGTPLRSIALLIHLCGYSSLPAYISLHITLSHRTYCLPTSIVHELTQLDGLSMTLFSIQSSRIISELRSK